MHKKLFSNGSTTNFSAALKNLEFRLQNQGSDKPDFVLKYSSTQLCGKSIAQNPAIFPLVLRII